VLEKTFGVPPCGIESLPGWGLAVRESTKVVGPFRVFTETSGRDFLPFATGAARRVFCAATGLASCFFDAPGALAAEVPVVWLVQVDDGWSLSGQAAWSTHEFGPWLFSVKRRFAFSRAGKAPFALLEEFSGWRSGPVGRSGVYGVQDGDFVQPFLQPWQRCGGDVFVVYQLYRNALES